MERYNEYKDSGVQWLGEIPSHWVVVPLKSLCKMYGRIGFRGYSRNDLVDEGEGAITLSPSNFINGKLDYTNCSYLSWEKYEESPEIKVNIGDVVFVKTASIGKVAYVESMPEKTTVNPQILVFKSIGCSPKLLVYYLKTDFMQGWIKASANGSTIFTIAQTTIGKYPFMLPPIEEQDAMVAYLDSATAKIDEAIAQQQKMIDLLNERKQIIINNAVTKGLNPDAPMKDSGVDWIGEIPEHWDVIKLKYIFRRIADGTHFSPETIEEGMPYITATDVRGKGIDFNETKKISQKDYEALVAAGCKPQLNDILLVKDGATTGRVGLMIDDTDCVTLSSVAMLSPQKKYSHLYLMYMMMSDFMQKQILLSMAGAAMPRITLIKLSNFIGIVPPMDEQESIATYIEKASMPIDSAIKSAEKQISLLQERKQIIINDVVTGKVKVC